MLHHGSLRAQRTSAFQAALRYIQNHDDPNEERRIACTEDGVVGISGTKVIEAKTVASKPEKIYFGAVAFAKERYDIDISSTDMRQRFGQIIQKYNVQKRVLKNDKNEFREIDNCAEASLWMTLEGLHSRNTGPGEAPRHLHTHRKKSMIWVFEIDSHFRPKEDSPCRNCQQWVRQEFGGLNGTKSL
jgi:hypothetical protein